MPRKQRAWLHGGNGKREGRRGYYACWNEWAGTRRTQRRLMFETQAAARQWVKQFNARRDLDLIGTVTAVSMSAAVREFLTGLGSNRSKATLMDYASCLGKFAASAGDREVGSYNAHDIERFMARKGVSQATIAKNWRTLRRFFSWAQSRAYCEANPTLSVTARPAQRHVRAKPMLAEAQLTALVMACEDAQQQLALQLAVSTGLDRSMIASLTMAQIDLHEMIIQVGRAKTIKRTGRMLSIPIHPTLRNPLIWLIRTGTPGKPLLPQTRYRAWWGRVRERAGLPDLRFADLRAVASVRMRQVIDPAEAARILGHSAAVALQHYSPPAPAVREQLAALPLPGSPDTQQP